MVSQTRGDGDRHHQLRGRGAAARGAADQALPPAVQRAAARRQKLPVHPAARRTTTSRAIRSIAARASPRATTTARSPAPDRSTPRSTRCRSCSCCGAAPTASSPAATGRACSTRSSAARRRASAGSTRPAMPSWSREAKDFLGGKSSAVQKKIERADGRGGRGARLRARGDAARPAARGDLHPGHARRSTPKGVGDADVFALACKGGHDRHPGVLRPRRAELGPSRVLPEPHRRTCRRTRCSPSLLAQFYEEVPPPRHDPGRPRAARARAARARRCARAAGRRVDDQRARSAATGGG